MTSTWLCYQCLKLQPHILVKAFKDELWIACKICETTRVVKRPEPCKDAVKRAKAARKKT